MTKTRRIPVQSREFATYLFTIKNQIKLANCFKASIEALHKHLDEVQNSKLALLRVDDENKVQCGIMPVDELDIAFATIVRE